MKNPSQETAAGFLFSQVAMRNATTHLSRDKVLKSIIRQVGSLTLKKDSDLYLSLLRSIVGQQLSVKAAATIWSRFLSIFPEQYPSPDMVLSKNAEELRKVGLSYQKAGYLRNIATFALEHSLDAAHLKKMNDEDLIGHLTKIKGVGRWTAEMVLMFSMARPDVLPLDDLGIRDAICTHYNLRVRDKKKQSAGMYKIAENWRPFRTIACMYLWKSRDLGIISAK